MRVGLDPADAEARLGDLEPEEIEHGKGPSIPRGADGAQPARATSHPFTHAELCDGPPSPALGFVPVGVREAPKVAMHLPRAPRVTAEART